MLTDDQAEELAQQLLTHPNYRIIRRLLPVSSFANPDGRKLEKAVIVDTETTGLDLGNDKIIEIGAIAFEYDPETGQAYRILETLSAMEDPGIPVPPRITEITGITQEMVEGRRFDKDKISQLLEGAAIIIAHNAKFDRPMLEKRFPIFESVPWGCSLAQVDWMDEGIPSQNLGMIALQFGYFFDAHRAEDDCWAVLQILQQDLPQSKQKAFKSLLNKLPLNDWTVFPESNFEAKGILKSRSYYWNPDRKKWNRTLTGTEAITSEIAWLKENIYGGREAKVEFEVRDAFSRYSSLPGKKVVKTI